MRKIKQKESTAFSTHFDDFERMFSEAGKPSEIRQARHSFGKSFQYRLGAAKCNGPSIFLVQLSIFRQKWQSLLT